MRREQRPAAPWTALAGAWLIGLAAAGCRSGTDSQPGARLSVRWTGADTAAFSAVAVAEWCASLHVLEIRAVAGDTGVGIALYPTDTVEAGVYPVRLPDVADTTRPPSAAVALRWFSETTVMGFQGDSGRLTLERGPDGMVAGRFTVGARPLVTGKRLAAAGTFAGLRIVTAPATCAGRSPGDTAQTDSTRDDEAESDSRD
jgi:hypothetical protein